MLKFLVHSVHVLCGWLIWAVLVMLDEEDE